MDRGFWVPLDKNLVKYLPINRKFTKLEAMFSLQLDLDNHGILKPENYYSKQWKWSGETVHRFIKEAKQNPSNETSKTQVKPKQEIRLLVRCAEPLPSKTQVKPKQPTKQNPSGTIIENNNIENNNSNTYINLEKFPTIKITSEEYEKLKAEFPNDYLKRIENLFLYIGSTGKKYKSHYLTILSWSRKEVKKPDSTKSIRDREDIQEWIRTGKR